MMAYKAPPATNGDWSQDDQDTALPAVDEARDEPPPFRPASTGGRAVGFLHFLRMKPAPVRYADRPMPIGTRLFGLGGTTLICALVLAAALFKWAGPTPVIVPTTLSVFDVAEPEAPPAPDTEIPPGPEQVQKEKPQVKVVETPPPPLIQVPSVSSVATPPKAERADDPGPPVDQTTAPQSSPKPPGAKASDAKPTWEGQVLAALNTAKRYPREAKRNRQQGMPWVRFTMDREGRVRSARIVRSSGFDALDREAEALPMRASPLPRPPESVKGERIELTVPVEFFM